jgi:hypothetical protein
MQKQPDNKTDPSPSQSRVWPWDEPRFAPSKDEPASSPSSADPFSVAPPPAETSDEPVESRDRARFEYLIAEAEAGLGGFYRTATALREIRDRKFYRLNGYTSFETFVRERFNLSRPYAYQLIDAATTVDELASMKVSATADTSDTADTTPLPNERQARALSGLTPAEKKEVWDESLAAAPEGKVTAAHVAKVRKQKKPGAAGKNNSGSPVSKTAPVAAPSQAASESETRKIPLPAPVERALVKESASTDPDPDGCTVSERMGHGAGLISLVIEHLDFARSGVERTPLSAHMQEELFARLSCKIETLRHMMQELSDYAMLCKEGYED